MWVPVSLPPGLARQATPLDTPGRWWDTNQVRWQAGNLTPIGGWSRLTAAPLADYVRKIHSYLDNAGNERLILGLNNKLAVYTDSLQDITPAGFTPLDNPGSGGGFGAGPYGDDTYGTPRSSQPVTFNRPRHWTLQNFGQDLLAVASSDGRLFAWPPGVGLPYSAATVAASAPTGNQAVVVTAERMCMLIGAGGDPRQVAWSNREEYSGTNAWDFASTTTTAGYLNLEVASPLVTGRRVREGVLVLSNREAVLMRYVGLPYIYGQEPLGKTTFRAPNLIASAGQSTVWLGDECFWIYDGGVVRPLPCPIFADIKEDLSQTYAPYRAFMSDNGVFPEVWTFYPSVDSVDGECDRYVIWNYAENWWARGALGRTAMYAPGPARLPYLAGSDKNLYLHEDGWTAAGVSRVGNIWAETCVLDAGGDSGGQIKHIMQAMLGGDITQSANYQARFYSRFAPQGTEYQYGPYAPRADGYMDTRVTGRDIRMRIEATTDDYWSVGLNRLDVRGGGKR